MTAPGNGGAWQPIETAPRDGSTILLTAFEDDGSIFEIHPMMWAHIQRNGLFPGVTGMWTAPDGAYTWNEDGWGNGPTHWKLSPTEAPTASATGRAADHSGVAGLGGE